MGNLWYRRLLIASLVTASVAAPIATRTEAAYATSLPELTVADVTTTEGDAGTAAIRVSVDLSAASSTTVRVPISLQLVNDGTADAADATMKSGAVTFLPGVTTKYVTVTTVGDMIVEPDQHFVVTLGTPTSNAVVTDGLGYVTIVDDDANGVNTGIEVSVGDLTLRESDSGAHKAFLPITLSRPATTATKVQFAMSCATAALLADVTISFSGSVSFPIGKRTAYIQFRVLPDTTAEQLLAFTQFIQSANVSVLDEAGSVTIIDDDGILPSGNGHPVPGFTPETVPSATTFDVGSPGDLEALDVGYDSSPALFTPFDPNSGNDWRGSKMASMSTDGRFVTFVSNAINLVPGDTNGIEDIFVRDRLLGTTSRITHNDGTQISSSDIPLGGHGVADRALSISADGNTVVFLSRATLVAADQYPPSGSWLAQKSIYSYDVSTRVVALESVDASGASLLGATSPAVSAHGRYVAFGVIEDQTLGSAYQAGGAYLGYWVRDRLTGTSTRVLADDNLIYTHEIGLSANGRVLAVTVRQENCTDSELDVIDLQTGNTERVDINGNGVGGRGYIGLDGFMPRVSGDGRFVSFSSSQGNLAYEDPDPRFTVPDFSYLRDRQTQTTTKLFHHVGRYKAIVTNDGNHVAMAAAGLWQISTNTTVPIGTPLHSADSWRWTTSPASGDGRYVAFTSTVLPLPNQLISSLFVQRMH